MVRFKDGLRGKGRVNSVIIDVKYNVKTCMYTLSALNQMIHLNVST